MQHSWPTCLIRRVAACQPRYWLTQIARVACRPVWGVKTIKREEGAQNSKLGLSSLQAMIFWRIPHMNPWTAVSLTFPYWLPSWVSLKSGFFYFILCFVSKFWLTFRPCMHPTEGSVCSACMLRQPLRFLLFCPIVLSTAVAACLHEELQFRVLTNQLLQM